MIHQINAKYICGTFSQMSQSKLYSARKLLDLDICMICKISEICWILDCNGFGVVENDVIKVVDDVRSIKFHSSTQSMKHDYHHNEVICLAKQFSISPPFMKNEKQTFCAFLQKRFSFLTCFMINESLNVKLLKAIMISFNYVGKQFLVSPWKYS